MWVFTERQIILFVFLQVCMTFAFSRRKGLQMYPIRGPVIMSVDINAIFAAKVSPLIVCVCQVMPQGAASWSFKKSKTKEETKEGRKAW